jgi:uncharacterized membrane protein
MSFCKACGKELPEGNMFCPACGASVAATTATPAAATAGGGAVAIVDGSAGQPMATNVAGALTYLAGLITGIIFVATEPYKSNSFNVAWIAIWMVWMVISAILTPLTAGIFGLVALPVMLILALTGLCTWLFLMYQAYQQKLFRLPFIGKYAAQQAGVNL